jgi:hypothetical protein
MKPALTVLTDPVPVGRYRLKEVLKRAGRPLRDLIRGRPAFRRSSAYRGHFGVTRSLVEGLRKIGVSASYNPNHLADVAETVVVLSGLDTLRQAIAWKREGRIRQLLAGPNILVLPSEHPDVIAAPEIDCCITPADWVCKVYESECPVLRGRCAPWPAGVDTEYWRPDPGTRESRSVVVFRKQTTTPLANYLQVLERRRLDVHVITYGSYGRDEYLAALRRSVLMVGFAISESQGLAWAEAWSADVPTLLWFQDHNVYRGRTFSSSTAPYLSASTGLFFSSVAEFEAELAQWEVGRTAFSPRRWVLENMSDEICARRLCRLAGVHVD